MILSTAARMSEEDVEGITPGLVGLLCLAEVTPVNNRVCGCSRLPGYTKGAVCFLPESVGILRCSVESGAIGLQVGTKELPAACLSEVFLAVTSITGRTIREYMPFVRAMGA